MSKLVDLLIEHEDNISWMYLDSKGNVTLGVGHLLTTAQEANEIFGYDVTVHFNRIRSMPADLLAEHYKYPGCPELTEDQIMDLLDSDIARMEHMGGIIIEGFSNLTEDRHNGVIDCMFTLGPGKFAGFHQTIKCIEAGDWEGAAQGIKDSVWYTEAHTRVIEDMALFLSPN